VSRRTGARREARGGAERTTAERAAADARFMREALALARRAMGATRPNPMVGCVIVKRGEVIARGYHHRAGLAHAEVDALQKLPPGAARGATVYVTLEPCNHHGRTGPCAEALVEAGVARVVVGMRDPNPHVKGGGAARLRRAGVAVEIGVLEEECRALNRAWATWIATGRPWVTLKAAVTLDGRIAARGGDSRWVSGEASRLEAHRLRAAHDAILVGAGTVAADDPALTTRLPEAEAKRRQAKNPQRVILDGRLSVDPARRAIPGAWVVTTVEAGARVEALRARGAEVIVLDGKGRVEPRALLEALGARGVQSLLVEGGGEVHGQLLGAGLVDEVVLFVAPKLVGSGGVPLLGSFAGPTAMAEAIALDGVTVRRLGDDVCISGRVRRSST
jgi:diaminohydroxyphosphoribosylaminopyrimidine deaminase/5-amino-6-(5-phosphoribosylamino)uracil reductase